MSAAWLSPTSGASSTPASSRSTRGQTVTVAALVSRNGDTVVSRNSDTVVMLNGAHTILYSADARATREFLRDVLDLPSVDAGDGWLIFALPTGEVAVHPHDGPSRHELYLMCDDIDTTVAELQAKGAQVSGPISEQGWGRLTSLRIPGGVDVGLYQPLHPTAIHPQP
jgi:predicted enzyme related to lactoylglutathione lyase